MKSKYIVLWFSFLLMVLTSIISMTGLLAPGFYSEESYNWQIQSMGQDIVNLVLVVPALLCSAILVWRNHKAGMAIWGGVILYCLYTFVIYCFSVHFNTLFLLYCFTLGLSVYAFLYFLLWQSRHPFHAGTGFTRIIKPASVYFFLVSCLFFLLWISDILPAILAGMKPQNLKDAGLFTNPVQVLDLSVILPGIFITGMLLSEQRPLGLWMTPTFLVFFILMDITIAWLTFSMHQHGLNNSNGVSMAMIALAVLSLVILVLYVRRMGKPVYKA